MSRFTSRDQRHACAFADALPGKSCRDAIRRCVNVTETVSLLLRDNQFLIGVDASCKAELFRY
ncbi:hypothetical protein [Solemya elarraichensis gill symbiont]|uniref:hypothetical protein n=1 Tax=Solemya elarraichensis gill symbiont TaxID=1918949 RepID=UPI001FE2E3A9|nr:hypothetical protein [Solemya elarraichensis gill symbiont]